MQSEPAASALRKMPQSLVAAILVSMILCLALDALTYGTNDVLFFQSYNAKAARDGAVALYRDGAHLVAYHPEWVVPMAFPPGMLNLWAAVQHAEGATGIPFRFWFRLLTTIAYLISIVLVWRLVSTEAAIYYALCPAAILISGFHGNADPMVVAALLASIYAAENRGRAALSGVLFGLAFSIKLWPLFLVPAFLLGLRTWRARIWFSVSAAAAAAVLALPHILADPKFIISVIMRHRPVSGFWGFSAIRPSYLGIGVPITFGAITVAAVYLRRRKMSLMYMAGSSILLFLVLAPSFGIQYLRWILPFCFLFGRPVTLGVYAATSVFLAFRYTSWSDGLPWYFADAPRVHTGWVNDLAGHLGAACWLTLGIAAVACLNLAAEKNSSRERRS
jgi:hypothetical protein